MEGECDRRTVNRINYMLEAAAIAYANANNGLLPQGASQIHGYLPEPIDPDRVQNSSPSAAEHHRAGATEGLPEVGATRIAI